jgi:hypothetical protein
MHPLDELGSVGAAVIHEPSGFMATIASNARVVLAQVRAPFGCEQSHTDEDPNSSTRDAMHEVS